IHVVSEHDDPFFALEAACVLDDAGLQRPEQRQASVNIAYGIDYRRLPGRHDAGMFLGDRGRPASPIEPQDLPDGPHMPQTEGADWRSGLQLEPVIPPLY